MTDGGNVDWQTPEFRQRIRDQLESYMKQQSISLPVNHVELERSVFEIASSKTEYMSRLQSCFAAATKQQKQQQLQQQHKQQQQQSASNDTNLTAQQNIINNNKNTNTNSNVNANNNTNNNNNNISQHQILLQQQLLQQQQQQQLIQQQQQQLDPMNALQHLTKQGLPQGQQGNQLLRPTSTGITPRMHQYPSVVNRPAQQVRGDMLPGNPRLVPSQFVAGLSPQFQQRNRQMQNMHAFNQVGGSPGNSLMQQQQQQATLNNNQQQQQATLNNNQQQQQQATLNNNQQQQQPLTPQQLMQLQQPSPAMPTPLGHQSMLTPSPSNHPTQSPATTLTHLSPSSKLQLPSPSHNLNTPANEDAEYLQKWEQLQRFIEPLKRTIHNLDKDGDRKLDLNKMKNLLDILSDKHKRLSLNTLLKCESVLERQLHMPPSGPPTIPPSTRPPSEGMVGQVLLDLIEAHLDHPCLTHTLQRTFQNNIHPYFRSQLNDDGGSGVVDGDDDVGGSTGNGLGGGGLGGEVVGRLGGGSLGGGVVGRLVSEVQRETSQLELSVTLDNKQLDGDHLLLICNLDRDNLPQVPSLMVSLPIEYPLKSPTPLLNHPLYESSDLFGRIKENLSFDLKRLHNNFTLTTLLNTWESAVIKSCNRSMEALK